ncbi:MAG: response regulator [Desulfovibrio sp.]|nr:response regulator [Desulfovibrio sp.]
MYKYNASVYLVDCPEPVSRIIETESCPDNFSQKVVAINSLSDFKRKADLLIVSQRAFAENIVELRRLASESEIILLSDGTETDDESMSILHDIWREPMTDREIKFRFRKWRADWIKEMDLWKANHYLETLLSTSPNLIWYKSREGVHTLVNDSFCRTVNKPKEDVQGKRHAYIWNVEDDDPACIESERKVMESGKVQIADEEIITGEGPRLLKTYKAPIRDRDGAMLGTMGIAVDVTRERDYYARLVRNNEALESIFTNMDCGVITHTLDGEKIVSVNRAALRLLGYDTQEEAQADGFNMVAGCVYADDRQRLRRAIAQLSKEGESASYEYRICHPDGKIYYVMGNAKLIEKDGELICQRFMMDCTSQKLAEEKELMEKEKRQQELIRALSVDYGVVFVEDSLTGAGSVLEMNNVAEAKMRETFSQRKPLKEIIDEYIDTCVHPDDRESLRSAMSLENLREQLAKKKIFYINYRVLDGNDVIYYQMKAALAGNLNDQHELVIGLQSINSRVRQEIEQKNRLAEALKAARKASTAKSIFLSNMSHDIRTPMNAVIGYTSLALAHLEDQGPIRDYLEKILASGNHLISLINNILDMSHIESGKIQLDEKAWDLSAILRELWNIVYPAAQAKKQTLIFNVDHVKDTVILCDKLRLNQLLLNLLSNSIKYTPDEGTIEMNVEETPGDDETSRKYEFRVKDNGIGMSEEFLTRIFEPFERAQTSTIAGIQGTGLGMAITRSIGEMMGGKIDVRSNLGEGTEFIFTVTLKIAEADDLLAGDGQRAAESTETKNAPSQAYQGSILLTEDNPMNQEIACEFLKDAGYHVDIANNGREAVDKLITSDPGKYDIVLMDVQMPVMDGYDATELIRALPDSQLAGIPIIAMTANSFEEDRQEALRRGMNAHIAKPIDFKVLFRKLDEILKI